MRSRLSRRAFLKTVGAGAAALALPWRPAAAPAGSAAAGAAAPAACPNIVFILADDLGFGDPQCDNPASKVPTPNIDRLAAEGVRFTDAHSGSSVCTPTRYGVLTGRYAWRTRLKKGVLGGYSPPLVERGRMTVASLLKAHGYRTACIGKWHLGLEWARKDAAGARPDDEISSVAESNVDFTRPVRGGPVDVGFDSYFGISASLDMPPYIFIENDRTAGLPTAVGEAKEFLRKGAREPLFHAVDVLPTLTKKAVEFIGDCAAKSPGKPFFLYFPLTAPHTPVAPADFARGKSRAGPYGDFVWEVDWTVGEVVKALDQHRMRDNTLLVVTSDNGSTNLYLKEYDHTPNAPWRGRKSDIWDGGHREPFIARWPARAKAGSVCDETVWLGDLLATAAAIVGDQLPPDAGEDSFNILPALLGGKLGPPASERCVVHHSIDGMFAIRQGPWKLVLGRGSGGWDGKGGPSDPEGQLYNMQTDPQEKENLYTRRPEIVRPLAAVLDKYKADGRSRIS